MVAVRRRYSVIPTIHVLKKLALLFAGAAFLLPAQAEEGGMYQGLRERWLENTTKQEIPAANASVRSRITKPGDYIFHVTHAGRKRMYRVHVPIKYKPNKPAPLLFALHGGGGNMNIQARNINYGHITQSETQGMIVVFPNGTSRLASGKLATWNAGKCCGWAREHQVDDVGFIRRIVRHVTRKMHIDRKRIYVTGMSNGAMMAYRLACEMSDVFAGIAAVAGTDNTLSCHPARPISILHIHAQDDERVLFERKAGFNPVLRPTATNFTSVPDTIAKWVRLNGCSGKPRRTLETEEAYCDVYKRCRGKAKVQLCVTKKGGHSWPGGIKYWGRAPTSQAISANEVMSQFFHQ